MNPLKHKFLPISFGISLFGLFFCAWNVFDFTESFCFTPASCTLFSEFAIFGISFWWFGIAFFMVSLLFALFGLAYFGKLFSSLGVILDFILLCVMLYTVPCINCLIIGSSIALVYIAFLYEGQRKTLPFPRPFLLLPWVAVFIMIIGSLTMSYARPWAIVGDDSAEIHIYFSTECSACTVLIKEQGSRDGIAWYPVQQNDDDIGQVKFLQDEIKKGTSFEDAYLKMRATTPSSNLSDVFSWNHWKLQFQLWKNAAYIMRAGQGRLPFVEFHGLPSVLLEKSTSNQNLPNQISNTGDMGDNAVNSLLGNIDAFCGDKAEPCPELTGNEVGIGAVSGNEAQDLAR